MRQFNWTSRTGLLGVLMMALTVPVVIGDTPQDDAYKKHFAAAKAAHLRRDFVQAEAELVECLKIRKDDPAVHFLAGRTARRSGNPKKAETHLKECERLKGDVEAIRLEQVLLRAQYGEFLVLENHLNKLVSDKHPETPLILEAQAQAYKEAWRYSRAMKCLDALLKVEPKNAHAFVEQGWIWRRWCGANDVWSGLGNPEKAVEAYRKALAIDPELFAARLGLAEVLLMEKNLPEAKNNFDKLHKSHPENSAVLLGLAACNHMSGEPEKAERRLADLLAKDSRNAAAWALRGKVANDPAQAEKWFRKALELDPNAPEYIYSLMVCLNQMGKREEAGQLTNKYKKITSNWSRLEQIIHRLESKPHDVSLRSEAGRVFLELGQDKRGVAYLYDALEHDPGHRATHRVLADYFDRVGQRENAAFHRKLAEKAK